MLHFYRSVNFGASDPGEELGDDGRIEWRWLFGTNSFEPIHSPYVCQLAANPCIFLDP